MIAVVVRIRLILFDGVSLGGGASREKAHAVHEQFGESAQLHPRAHEGRRGHVVDEKGTVVRKKNAAPSDGNKENISQCIVRKSPYCIFGTPTHSGLRTYCWLSSSVVRFFVRKNAAAVSKEVKEMEGRKSSIVNRKR